MFLLILIFSFIIFLFEFIFKLGKKGTVIGVIICIFIFFVYHYIFQQATIAIVSVPRTYTYQKDSVRVEKIKYEMYEDPQKNLLITTYWTGVAEESFFGGTYPVTRKVKYELHSNGKNVCDGIFYTEKSLVAGEKFFDNILYIDVSAEDRTINDYYVLCLFNEE